MGLLSKALRPEMNHNYVGAPSFRTHNPYFNLFDCYYADEYASQFPNIRPIANEYMKIRPYAIGSNGEPVPHPVIDALYHPNKQDSSVLFAEKIAVSTLSLPITYILVWRNQGGEARPGGPFGVRGRNVAGFTFLENPSIDVRDGRKYYRIGSQEFTEDDVMELPGGAKPGNLYAGYSPSQAASRWSTLDSYIADFQKGFFENGAVPAGQFVITAVSEQDFKDTVKKMQDSHRGAGKNNNVTYTPRPVDPNTQKPADAKIEWIPYQQSNKDIDFKPLLEHVDNRLSESYGVSAIIKGVDSQATYNNAEVSENGFAKRAVEPLALRNYTQITHELNRITGGLGVAITYKYQIPAISDAELVKAQTKQVEVNMINALIAQGFTLDSAVDALELSNAYKLLQIGEETTAEIKNDKPDVDEGNEVKDAPDPEEIDGVTPLNRKKIEVKNQISSRDYPDLYEGTDVDPSDLGCIMVDTEPLKILSVVEDGDKDLVEVTDRHDHQMGAVAELEPHVTLLYGLLENGNTWKDKVDTVLDDWKLDTVKIEEVSYFNLPDSYAVIAHIEKTTDLLDGHDRLTLLPHINTFSTYKPHMTLAYIKKEADLGKWLTSLNEQYAGKELKVTGLNYGDLPEEDDSDDDSSPKNKVERELHCKSCDRFLGTTTQDSYADKLKCSNSKCKALEVPTVNEAARGKNPKAELGDEQKLEAIARQYMQAQIDRAVQEYRDEPQDAAMQVQPEPTDDELDAFVVAMYAVIIGILLTYGEEGYATGVGIAGLLASDLQGFTLTETAQDSYRAYLRRVGTSYGQDTAESIRKALADARGNGLTRTETEDALRNIMNTDDYRIKRLARTELNNSQNIGKLEGIKSLASEVGGTWEKTIDHSGVQPCPLCASQEGIWTAIDQPLWDFGDSITATDENGEQTIYVNDWQADEANDYHPNGRGTLIFRRVAE